MFAAIDVTRVGAGSPHRDAVLDLRSEAQHGFVVDVVAARVALAEALFGNHAAPHRVLPRQVLLEGFRVVVVHPHVGDVLLYEEVGEHARLVYEERAEHEERRDDVVVRKKRRDERKRDDVTDVVVLDLTRRVGSLTTDFRGGFNG